MRAKFHSAEVEMLCCNTLTCNGCDSVLGEEGCVCVRAFRFFPNRCRNQASVLRLEKQIPELLDKEVLEKKKKV